jgi:hypothetical protein
MADKMQISRDANAPKDRDRTTNESTAKQNDRKKEEDRKWTGSKPDRGADQNQVKSGS